MCGRGLLKEIAATHRNGTGGRAQIELGGSPSNTNRGVQPTCIRLRACRSDRKVRCVVVVSSRRSRSHIGPGRCVAHKIQVGGSPYNTNRGVQPTCVEADARTGLLRCCVASGSCVLPCVHNRQCGTCVLGAGWSFAPPMGWVRPAVRPCASAGRASAVRAAMKPLDLLE